MALEHLLGHFLLLLSFEDYVQEIVRNIRLLHLLILQQKILKRIECLSETLYNFVSQETVFGGIILVVQWIKDDEIGLRGAMLEERASIGHIDSEKGNVEVVAIIVKESHE